MRSFDVTFATAGLSLLLLSLLLFSVINVDAMPIQAPSTDPIPESVIWDYFGTSELVSLVVSDGGTSRTTFIKPQAPENNGQPWTCHSTDASPLVEDVDEAADSMTMTTWGIEGNDIDCLPDHKYVVGEYPNQFIDQSKIEGPKCWRVSMPYDTALIGICGLPSITKCTNIKKAAKAIRENCATAWNGVAGGTYNLEDSDMVVLVYHAAAN